MKKLSIEPGCTTCGLCEFIAPEIFELTDSAHIKKDAPVEEHADAIDLAVKSCPVNVIVFEQKGG